MRDNIETRKNITNETNKMLEKLNQATKNISDNTDLSTEIKEFVKDKISTKLGIKFSIENTVGVRLFLIRCSRNDFLKHISRYYEDARFPQFYKNTSYAPKSYDSGIKRYLYGLAVVFDKFDTYIIKLNRKTWLKVSLDNETSYVNLYFIGKDAIKYLYFLQKTIVEVNDSFTNYPRISSIDECLDEHKGSYYISEIRHNSDDLKSFNNYMIDDFLKDKIFNYINNALSTSKMFNNKFSLTYSPGIIFYGEPGTGKSSIIEAIGNDLNAHIVYVNLLAIRESIKLIDTDRCNDYDQICILVYEDIDFLFTDRYSAEDPQYKNNYNLLLQVLDGYLSVPNSINIATTNYIEKLDPALVRDGRFDLKIELKGLEEKEAKRMCEKFEVSEDILDEESFPINPSKLQKKILTRSKNDIIKSYKSLLNK